MDPNRHQTVSLANSDLRQWKHVEYAMTENGIPLVTPFGFSTDKLAKLKIKNINLQQ
ncbi:MULTISPECIES: hypothetical protein [unclassified Enterococcus]|uniref:hypothetical protein n=1 Tax=unclassified Enterococcus TaxID=2608891 RepID=UPI0028FD5594|nr:MULTISPECIES: hypothetical protein [unclassified Enterococcus]MDU0320672.1 hypothetical protein [Enterococcus sp. 2STP]MDU0333957.1 hypothetical protein [Enterococcus sp. 2CBP]MDU0350392.1 hypothetical protein [Enterococcus sp. 3MOLP]